MSSCQLIIGSNSEVLVETIDMILRHHYFQSELEKIVHSKNSYNDSRQIQSLQDQYYKQQQQVVEDIAQILNESMKIQMKEVLSRQFINISAEIDAIKNQIYTFMDEYVKKFDFINKQFNKISQEVKKRNNAQQVVSSTLAPTSYTGYSGGIRFIRNSNGATTSTQNVGSSNVSNESKSFYSQLNAIKKQIEQIRQNLQKSESLKFLEQNFNEFRIETKVALEGLKQKANKLSVDQNTLSKNSFNPTSIKQNIEATVKRTISANLKVYGNYSTKISEIQASIENIQQKIEKKAELHNEYLSNQLKSVWLVLNDMKKNIDDVMEILGVNSSRDML